MRSVARFARETLSNQELLRLFFDAARAAGLGAYVGGPEREIRDDHLSFMAKNIPSVDLIDFGARSKLLTIATAERAAGVSAAPNGQRIYVANGSGSVSVIDVASHVVIREISVGKRPWNMALTPDGRKLYVANGRSNSVSIIDTGKLAVVAEVAVGEMPWGVVIPQSKPRGD